MHHAIRIILFLFLPLLAASQEPIVRICLLSTRDHVTILPHAGWHADVGRSVRLESGSEIVLSVHGRRVVIEKNGIPVDEDTLVVLRSEQTDASLTIRDVPFGVGWWWAGQEDRVYEGQLEVHVNTSRKLTVVAVLPLERYLEGVVPYEIGPESPMEALKAQTVAARSETIAGLQSGVYRGDGYDICSDVECQVFAGIARRTPVVVQAIEATRALVLTSAGRPIGAYYASNCGGYSENVENVFPERSGAVPYWSAHADGDVTPPGPLSDERVLREWIAGDPPVYCNAHLTPGMSEWSRRNFRWTVTTPAETLSAWVNSHAPIGRVVCIDSIVRGASGRIIRAVFVGEKGSWRVNDQLAFRQVWQAPLRSSCAVIDTEGPQERPTTFILHGAGWGHGVGMCQSGAVGMALRGKDFREILAHYYRTAEVEKMY